MKLVTIHIQTILNNTLHTFKYSWYFIWFYWALSVFSNNLAMSSDFIQSKIIGSEFFFKYRNFCLLKKLLRYRHYFLNYKQKLFFESVWGTLCFSQKSKVASDNCFLYKHCLFFCSLPKQICNLSIYLTYTSALL